MPDSAIMGQPPNNQDDLWTLRGLARHASIPDDEFDPSKGFPTKLQVPPAYHHETRGSDIIVAMSVAIALVTIITGARLCLRCFHRDLKWGWDDWMIIPGAVCCLARNSGGRICELMLSK